MVRAAQIMMIAALAAMGMPTLASARLVYFHKAGVVRDAFAADATECESLAAGVQSPSIYQPYSPNIAAAGTAACLSGFMKSRERRGIIDNVLRTCMFDKGYRRIEASEDLEDAIDRLSGVERLERLAALAAAEEPRGKVLPR